MPRSRASVAAAAVLIFSGGLRGDEGPFQGSGIEQFLAQATVIRMRAVGRSVTRPRRATLTRDGQTHDAAWQTTDEARAGLTSFAVGRPDVELEDTYRAECAAYELDRLLDLGMVPATVERIIGGERGALTLWIEPHMAEADRYAQGLDPPDGETWNRQMDKVRLFDNLIFNTDRNPQNILVTPQWQIRLIGHSRAFRKSSALRDAQALTRFSRSLLQGIQRLDETTLKARLGRFISVWHIRALLERRDHILALAERLASRHGAAAVYYP